MVKVKLTIGFEKYCVMRMIAEDATKETRLDAYAGSGRGWIRVRGQVQQGRFGEPCAEERGQREGTGPDEGAKQGVLQIENDSTLGTSRHEAQQIGHPPPRGHVHRSSSSRSQRRRGPALRDQVFVPGAGKFFRERERIICNL